jgi:hypothetical protein
MSLVARKCLTHFGCQLYKGEVMVPSGWAEQDGLEQGVVTWNLLEEGMRDNSSHWDPDGRGRRLLGQDKVADQDLRFQEG